MSLKGLIFFIKSSSWLHKEPLKNQTQYLTALSRCFLKSGKLGVETVSLGKLLQCLTTLLVDNFLLISWMLAVKREVEKMLNLSPRERNNPMFQKWMRNIWLSWVLQASLSRFVLLSVQIWPTSIVTSTTAISPQDFPEPLCWSTALLEVLVSTCGIGFPLSLPLDTDPLTPRHPLSTTIYTTYIEIWPLVTPCLFWWWGLAVYCHYNYHEGFTPAEEDSWEIIGRWKDKCVRKKQTTTPSCSQTLWTYSTLSQIPFTDLQLPRWQTLESFAQGHPSLHCLYSTLITKVQAGLGWGMGELSKTLMNCS